MNSIEKHFHDRQPLLIYFVRHGQAESGDGDGPAGPALTKVGRLQCRAIAKRLADEKFNMIYCSTLKRALETAKTIRENHVTTPFFITPDLREVMSCHFTGPTASEKKEMAKHIAEERQTIDRFIAQIKADHKPGEKILMVCHGNIIRTMMPLFGGREPAHSVLMDIYNTGLSILDVWRSGEAVLKMMNCVKHLSDDQVT